MQGLTLSACFRRETIQEFVPKISLGSDRIGKKRAVASSK